MKLILGAAAPQLKKQLTESRLNKHDIMTMQWDADAITRLHARRILTDSAARQARKNLLARIKKTIESAR